MEEPKKEKEKKPFNVVLLGNIESEKAALLHKFIKKRFAIKQLKEIKMNEENDKLDDSNMNNSMNNVEIHGETIKMKIYDNVSANKIFSSSNKNLKIAQGIILFYSVADRKSFNILKLSLSKMIDFDKYDIPMLMVGSDSDTPNRQVTYEEAKSLADSYGLRFYETSIKYGMNGIFEDIGEQVFYEEYGNDSNNKNKNNNYYLPKCKSQKNINKNISIYSTTDFYKTDFNSNLKKGIDFRNNISNFSLIKERNKSKIDLRKTNEEFNSDMDMDESLNSFRKKNIKNRSINNIIKSPDIINNKLLLNNSPSSILLSYQGTTEASKKREEEIRERRIKKEKEMKSWWKKRERENIEIQKKKKKIEKEELQKKIKEDKINQKDKEKKVMEEINIKMKNNYENKKRNNKFEKSKRLDKMSDKRYDNDNENSSISKEQKEKLFKNKLNNRKNNIQNRSNKANLSFNNTETNFYKNKRNNENKSNKLRANKLKNKSQNKKNKDNLENSSVISDDIIKQNSEIKNNLIEMYQKNSNIYRCLKCKLIPNIIINEYNQEIEVFCDKSFCDQSHHNITTYSNFQDLSLNHPIDGNSVFCHYCNKVINELTEGKTIYYCCLCDIYYCTEDEELHKNEKHKNKEEIKEKYLQILSKKNNIITSSSQNTKTKTKTLIKQKSTPLLLKDINNNKKPKKGNKIINNSINNDGKNEKNEKNKIKNENKIQIFLMDSFCANHFQIFKYYCYNCHKNICDLCENEHKDHNKIKLEDILLDEDELMEKKNKLNKEKEELIKINDCFNALIEAIKRKFERLYNIKQKELDIKEKIIKDYETIKYNFHSIENVHNLKFNNNYYIDKSNNSDWFHRFNLIFKYLNSSLNNKSNDIFDLLNNRNENNNIKIISNNNMNKINKLIILKNEDIAISNDNKIIIYDKFSLEEKLNIDAFKNNSRINSFIEKEGGSLLCAGYECIKSISLSLNNKSYYIEDIIYEKSKDLNSIIELNNNYLILLNNNSILELWKKNYKIKKYELIDNFYLENNNLNDNSVSENYNFKEENNSIFKINYNSFILSEKDNIKMFKINDYNKIELKFELDNIKLVKGNNSLIKLLDEDYILLSCYEYKNNILYDENEYNNSKYFDYSIKLIDINNFNIIGNFNNNHPFIDMSCYIDNIIIGLDSNGIIYKFELDKYQQNLFLLDKIYYKSNLRLYNDKINGINLDKNKKSIILNINDKIISISNFD